MYMYTCIHVYMCTCIYLILSSILSLWMQRQSQNVSWRCGQKSGPWLRTCKKRGNGFKASGFAVLGTFHHVFPLSLLYAGSLALLLSRTCARNLYRCFLWVPLLSPCPSLSFPFSFPSLTGSEHDKCDRHRVAPINRLLLKIISLFCKRALQKRLYSAKETLNFKEPTNRSHPNQLAHAHTNTLLGYQELDHTLTMSLNIPSASPWPLRKIQNSAQSQFSNILKRRRVIGSYI